MKEGEVVEKSPKPNTINSLYEDFKNVGIKEGDTILVHSSLSALGWTSGNAVSVIEALMKAVGSSGNIIMPAHSSENSDTAQWQHPPVPESWWPIIRAEAPAFDPLKTPTRGMGTIAETFRTFPNVKRSNHPQASFTAYGPKAEYITTSHQLTPSFGAGSPLEKNVELDGKIVLLGVTHENNTSLHYADWKATYSSKGSSTQSAAMFVNGNRQWVDFTDLKYDDDDFMEVGLAYESSEEFTQSNVGIGLVRVFPAKKLVEFAISWFEAHRK